MGTRHKAHIHFIQKKEDDYRRWSQINTKSRQSLTQNNCSRSICGVNCPVWKANAPSTLLFSLVDQLEAVEKSIFFVRQMNYLSSNESSFKIDEFILSSLTSLTRRMNNRKPFFFLHCVGVAAFWNVSEKKRHFEKCVLVRISLKSDKTLMKTT